MTAADLTAVDWLEIVVLGLVIPVGILAALFTAWSRIQRRRKARKLRETADLEADRVIAECDLGLALVQLLQEYGCYRGEPVDDLMWLADEVREEGDR